MLTSQDRFVSMKTSRFELMMAGGVGACLFLLLLFAATSVPEWRGMSRAQAEAVELQPTATPIGMGLLGARVDAPDSPDAAGYLLVFEIISVHLLVVLVGAAYLARAKRKGSAIAE
jgi:NADH-quinone oxidoreductase subunit J